MQNTPPPTVGVGLRGVDVDVDDRVTPVSGREEQRPQSKQEGQRKQEWGQTEAVVLLLVVNRLMVVAVVGPKNERSLY